MRQSRGVLEANNEIGGLAHFLLDRGVAVVTAAYRLLCAGAGGSDMVEDVEDALLFLQAGAAERWGLDKDRLALWGHSAGGHLGLVVAYGSARVRVRGVVAFYPPTELRLAPPHTDLASASWLTQITHQVIHRFSRPLCEHQGDRAACDEDLSPVALVRPGAPPTLIIHGEDDAIVPVDHARWLAAALERHAVPHALIEVPAATHSCELHSSAACAQAARFALDRFIASVLAA
jgi:acetyl esterase/lipase